MPIDVVIDEKNDLILRTAKGVITADEVVLSVEETLSDPRYHSGMRSLTDLREVAHRATREDISRITTLFFQHSEQIMGGKAAVVVSRAASYGTMRLLQTHLEALPFQMAVFYEIDEAREWLGIA